MLALLYKFYFAVLPFGGYNGGFAFFKYHRMRERQNINSAYSAAHIKRAHPRSHSAFFIFSVKATFIRTVGQVGGDTANP